MPDQKKNRLAALSDRSSISKSPKPAGLDNEAAGELAEAEQGHQPVDDVQADDAPDAARRGRLRLGFWSREAAANAGRANTNIALMAVSWWTPAAPRNSSTAAASAPRRRSRACE